MLWLIFFFIAVLWTCVILFQVILSLNTLEKRTTDLLAKVKEHYGTE